jgi:hypothetical protein
MITIHWLLLVLFGIALFVFGFWLCGLMVAGRDRPMHPRFNGEQDDYWDGQKH